MAPFDKYKILVSSKIIGKEEMLNLCDLVKCLEEDKDPFLIEPCLIIPYYINENKRYELYQYEFCLEQQDGETFEEYLLRMTGKRRLEEVPKHITKIRQMSFARIEMGNEENVLKRLIDWAYFLMNDDAVKSEIVDLFAEFDSKKLFVGIY